MTTPSTTPLTINVKGNNYTVERITVGNLMDIEIIKAQLCKGQYGSILSNRTQWSEYTLDNVDMFAHLMSFFPTLITALKVESWEQLDPFDVEELKKIYQEEFVVWFKNFSQVLKNPKGEDKAEQNESTAK